MVAFCLCLCADPSTQPSASPSLYQPRLGSVRDVRKEMVRVYRAAKRGEIDVQLVGRLVHTVNSLVAIGRDHCFEARIEALEQGHRANGSTTGGRWEARL